MASIIDDDDELTGNREQVGETKPAADTSTNKTDLETKAPPAKAEEDKLGKFKGKSAEEIAAAYAELEQRFGAQGAEIGEMRKFTDSLIRSDLERRQSKQEAPSKTEPQPEDDDVLFFTNPREAIKRELERNQTIKDLAQHRSESQQERAKRITYEKHPDADSLVNDPEFQSWVKSSKVRSNLFVAACNFDADAAIELFDTFKALNSTKATASQGGTAPAKVDTSAAEAAVDAQRKAASAAVGTSGGEPAGDTSKPIYSRRKIMELMVKNPAEYEARSDEFLAAYAEGRVRK